MEEMKAFVRTNAQDRTVELANIALPEIDDHEVLIEVQAFGVGIHDRFFIPRDARFPYPIGTEGAGVITKTGHQVTEFQAGDRVIFTSVLQPKGGCWAQYAAVSEQALIPMPDTLAYTEGAAIPIAGKTALESMHALDLQEGDTLFVAGASGAIGTLVIQLAAAQGVRIVGSASSQNHAHMRSLGAEAAVDYTDPDWKSHVEQWMPGGVDKALAIQPGTGKDSMDVVRSSGEVITVSGDKVAAPERGITVRQFEHHDTQDVLIQLVSDIVAGKIHLVIEHVYLFDQAIEALQKTETRHARGKLVVDVTAEEARGNNA